MVIYALIVYALMNVVIFLSLFSFYKPVLYFYHPVIKVLLIGAIFGLCFIPFFSLSFASIFYNLFDTPSFSLLILSLVGIFRIFVPNMNILIGYRGFIALFVIWFLITLNALDIWTWAYGKLSFEIYVSLAIIAIIYCIDRICATLLLVALVLWLIFPKTMSVYNGLFDCMIAIFGFCMQPALPTKTDFIQFARNTNYLKR